MRGDAAMGGVERERLGGSAHEHRWRRRRASALQRACAEATVAGADLDVSWKAPDERKEERELSLLSSLRRAQHVREGREDRLREEWAEGERNRPTET